MDEKIRIVPSLLVKDISESVDFYKKLGFELTGCHPAQAEADWAEVSRNGVSFQFYTEPPIGTETQPVCSGTFYLHLDTVTDLVEELKDTMDFVWGPEIMEYGMVEFAVRDPNGYLIAFAQEAP